MDSSSHDEAPAPRVPIYERRVWKWVLIPAAVLLVLILLGLAFTPNYWRF
ncbi:MAG: hypothetical protein PVJ02_16910 [Gemmatimonadota bacterium]|jgi:hypothetical protein